MNKLSIQSLVRGYSIETTIREAKRVKNFSDLVPAGTSLYIVHVPGDDFKDTVALAARLRREGMEPVPHIVARRMHSVSMLDDFIGRLTADGGVKQVLIVAGDVATPAGEVHSALQILDSGILEKYQVRIIGVAGHPEGHRDLDDAILRDALKRKNAYARKTGSHVYIVTQFTFAAEPIIAWETSHATDIGQLPIAVGLPGLASAKTLVKYAIACGIGPSLQAFSKRAGKLTKLLTVSAPDETIVGLARYKDGTSQTRINQIHFFPFGGFKRTADWANNIVAGNFDLTDDGGLRVVSTADVR